MGFHLPLSGDPEKNSPVFLIALLISLLGAVVSVVMVYRHVDYRRDIVLETKKEVRELTGNAARDIDDILRRTMGDADALGADLTGGKTVHEQALDRLKRLVEENSNYYGAALVYRPFGHDPGRRLSGSYYKRDAGGENVVFTLVEDDYDYTLPEYEWYALPMREGSRWSEPYWCPSGKTYMVTYSSVFHEIDSKPGKPTPLGLIVIDISMDRIKKIIDNVDLGPSGFGAMISRKGIYLHHPNREYVVAGKSITDVARDKGDKNRLLSARMASRGRSGILDHISTTTRKPAWLVVAPVPTSGWSLQNTFLKRDIEVDVDTLRRQLIWIVFSVLVSLLACFACIYFKMAGSRRGQWIMIAAGATGIVLAVGAIWVITLTYNPADKISGVRVSDKATLGNIMRNYLNRSREKHLERPVFVPTGVFIESVKFSGPSDVLLSGYIWQKYGRDIPDTVKKELMISKAGSVSIREMERSIQNGTEVIISHFEAEVRQKLTHRTYPLEQERIELSIIHRELAHNIVLVPDLDAYAIRSASLLPGLDKGAFISGWKLKKAYYELRKRELNTNFGLGGSISRENYPVLYYNVGIQRNFIDAFISNLTPLIFVAIMLFFLLLLSNSIDGAKSISICVAMFFVIVFSHIDIRSKISAQEIFYLEYFFFLTYGSILYVALNAGGALLKSEIPFCNHNSRGPRRMFWPVFLGIIFCVTMNVFLNVKG